MGPLANCGLRDGGLLRVLLSPRGSQICKNNIPRVGEVDCDRKTRKMLFGERGGCELVGTNRVKKRQWVEERHSKDQRGGWIRVKGCMSAFEAVKPS